MTEPLFRFLLLRPPVTEDPTQPPITLVQASDFQRDLAAAAASTDARNALITVSKAYIASDKFVTSIDGTAFQKQVAEFSNRLDKTEAIKKIDFKDIESLVNAVFDKRLQDLVASDDFIHLLQRLRDSVVAIKYVQAEHTRPIADLTNQIRDLELIQKAAAHKLSISDPTPIIKMQGKKRESQHEDSALMLESASQWAAGKHYAVGDRVLYNERTYECIQSHVSQDNWIPTRAPSLWKLIKSGDPSVPVEEEDLDLSFYRKRPLLLPVGADLKSIIASSAEERKKVDDDRKKAAKEAEEAAQKLLQKHGDLKVAINELVKLSPDHLEVITPDPDSGTDVDQKFTRSQLIAKQIDYQSSLRQAALTRVAPPAGISLTALATADPTPTPTPTPAPSAEPTGAFNLAKDLLGKSGLLAPRGKWQPVTAGERTPRMKSTASSVLSEKTKTVLSERGINLQTAPINRIVTTLRRELSDHIESLKQLAPEGENVSYTRMGTGFIAIRSPIVSLATSLLYGVKSPSAFNALPALPLDGRIPHTKGKVSPAGVADLLVVKQTLKAYQAADIAHVENILKGESKQRTHTKTTRTETTVNLETESSTSEEHELSSTSRFEMSKEVSNTLKEDESLKAELKVSAKYGPAVTMDASVAGSISRNKEEVNKTASKFSQDVTQRTVKKITERVLQKQITTTISEIVEKNEHGVNNANGSGHISGVYQWLNKVYEAQIFNYGLRMMFEFMIPEPAAFLIHALSTTSNSAEANLMLEKPAPFILTPSEITEEAVGSFITKYGATDVLPPPEPYITICDQAKATGGDDNTNYDHGALLTVPAGYEAVYATVTSLKNIWEKNCSVDVMIGSGTHRFTNDSSWAWGTSVINQLGSDSMATGGTLAWGFNTFHIADCVVSVEVLCRVTERRKQQWQAETHAKLLTAYKARMQEYEEKLARLKLENGITIQGTNPTANLNVIKSELKKNCISVLTGQHYDLFNSISKNPTFGYPEINLYEAEAEGSYVRFFEQAFEWDQIMYITYPYFWGRMGQWVKKLTINDPDPVFDEFLKSGFARVVVPARPGFEGAIDHFMEFGELWNGGALPPISSKLYVPIASEIAERTGKPEGELPQGEPWDVVLPTTLVKLRGDDKLPTWHKTPGGKWEPDV